MIDILDGYFINTVRSVYNDVVHFTDQAKVDVLIDFVNKYKLEGLKTTPSAVSNFQNAIVVTYDSLLISIANRIIEDGR